MRYQEPDTLLWYKAAPGEPGENEFLFVTKWGDRWAAHVGLAVHSGERVEIYDTDLEAAEAVGRALDCDVNRRAGLKHWNAGL